MEYPSIDYPSIEQVCEKMQELFGDKVVNPDHQPLQFKYQIKLAKWMLQTELNTPTEIQTCAE